MAVVPYTFANASSPIPLSQLDANFAAIGTGSFLSVVDFGATGNGTTNDAAAIQAAINAAALLPPNGKISGLSGISGATVYFPPGVYRINSGLTIVDGIVLAGNGERSSVINYYGSGSAISNATPGTRIGKIGITNMTIANKGSGTIGLDLNSVSYSDFANLWIDSFTTAVKINSPTSGWSVYNRFYNVTANVCTNGYILTGSSSNAHTFYACRYNTDTPNTNGVGWQIDNSNGNQIMACHADMVSNNTYFAKLTSTAPGANNTNVFWGNRIEGDLGYTVYGFSLGTDVQYTVIGGNYYTAIDQVKCLTDNGLGNTIYDPVYTTPGISAYVPWDGVVGGQITYRRDGSGQFYYPFMVLNDNNASSGVPVTLQILTQRQTGQSIQVLRQESNLSISGIQKTITANISGITKANPCVITTSTNHGIAANSLVYLSNIGGMTQLNGYTLLVTAVTSNTLTLGSVDSTSFTTYTSGGTALAPTLITTTGAHGLAVGSQVALSGIGGMTQLNGVTTTVSGVATTTKFCIQNIDSSAYTAYTSGGTIVPQAVQFAVQGNGYIAMQNVAKAASSPQYNADYIGQLYVDTNGNAGYIAYRTGFGSGDWKIIT